MIIIDYINLLTTEKRENMFKFPENWFIIVTDENQEVLNNWRRSVCRSHSAYYAQIDTIIVSKHPKDDSYAYCGSLNNFVKEEFFYSYKEISFDLFKRYVLKEIPEYWNIKVETKAQFDEVIDFLNKQPIRDKYWLDLNKGFDGGSRFIRKTNCKEGFGYSTGDNGNYSVENRITWDEFLSLKHGTSKAYKFTPEYCKTNNVGIYVKSQEDIDGLKQLNCLGHLVNLANYPNGFYTFPKNNSWSTNCDVENAEFISASEFITQNSNLLEKVKSDEMTNKEIIGYKLIKPKYAEAAKAIMNMLTEGDAADYINTYFSFKYNIKGDFIKKLKEAGVLDLWFEPIYKNTPKVGDYIYIIEPENGAFGAQNKVGVVTDEIATKGLVGPQMAKVKIGAKVWAIGKNWDSVQFRQATEKEIRSTQIRELNIGSKTIKVNISRDKIVAENREIGIKGLKSLVALFDPTNYREIPWTVNFVGKIKIGCSEFTIGELRKVIEEYELMQ